MIKTTKASKESISEFGESSRPPVDRCIFLVALSCEYQAGTCYILLNVCHLFNASTNERL